MTAVNILKYLLFAKEKNESTDVRHLVYTINGLSFGMPERFKGYLLTVYTVSYIPPLSQSDCRKLFAVISFITI